MGRNDLPQRWRFVAFGLNVTTFYGFFVWATGDWIVDGGGESVWLVAAIGWWVLGLLSAPWYRPPRDALAAAVGSFVLLATIDTGSAPNSPELLASVRVGAVVYVTAVALLALSAGWSQLSESRTTSRKMALWLSSDFARGEALFGGAALISIFGFYESMEVQLALVALWAGFAFLRPFESLIGSALRAYRERKVDGGPVGRVRRIDHPDLIRVSLTSADNWKRDSLHVARLADESYRFVLPLFVQVHDSELLATGICGGDPDKPPKLGVGEVSRFDSSEDLKAFISDLSGGDTEATLVGFVIEGSKIGRVRFEVAEVEELEEGKVVYCAISGERVYYQILDAATSEESFAQNPRGTQIVDAVQLGTYHTSKGFQKHPWLPSMNHPVFLASFSVAEADKAETRPGDFEIGLVPSTTLAVQAHLPDLITHHSAILGVTGTGKTELTFDIIREAIEQGYKVACVDLTGEYARRLADLNPMAIGLEGQEADDLDQRLFDVETGTYGAGEEKAALKQFLDELAPKASERVNNFLSPDDSRLAILELAEVTNTRATLRTTELFLTEMMLWARSHRGQRQILIVLEEAHTIIPETRGSGFDYDTQWVVSRIGQIALQGRKYGVGLLLVSQRTALVSKTILSQCNTYFAHALVDQTSLDYLANVFSREYVLSVPNLRFLEFMAFGKAVRSERPVLVRRPFIQDKLDASEA